MKKLLIALPFFLSSCAIMQSKEVATGCRVADSAVTKYATTHGFIETNPAIKFLLGGASSTGFFIAQGAFIWYL